MAAFRTSTNGVGLCVALSDLGVEGREAGARGRGVGGGVNALSHGIYKRQTTHE